MVNNKLLISSSAKNSIKESADFASKIGCGLEISRIPLYKTQGMTLEETIEQLKTDLAGFKNRITFHAMFSDVNVSSSDYEIRAVSQKRVQQSFEAAKAIGADTVLFHTGYKGTKHSGSIYCFKRGFADFWRDFIQEFVNAGMTAVIENVFETSPDFDIDLFEKTGSDNFKLALDTGHVNLYADGGKITDWIKAYGKNLHHMHIHNNYGLNDDHSNLLNGTLDFKKIIHCLKETEIEPSMVLEMFSEEDVLKSAAFLESCGIFSISK